MIQQSTSAYLSRRIESRIDLFKFLLSILSGIYLVLELLGHTVILFNFLRNCVQTFYAHLCNNPRA